MAEIIISTAKADGVFTECRLPVKSLTVKRDRGAADMLELKLWGAISEFPVFIKLHLAETQLFDGIVDDMISSYDENGKVTELVARNRVSLLTDNQLRPCTLRNPSLRLFAERYLAPLGFSVKGNMVPFRGEMKITEGTSVLKGLRQFCGSFLGTEPEIRRNIVYCHGGGPEDDFRAELPVVSRERSLSRYGVPSKIYAKNSRSGAWSACSENPEDMGFERVVYGEGDFGVKARLELLLAGCADLLPGDSYGGEVRAESVRISFDREGWKTRIMGEEL